MKSLRKPFFSKFLENQAPNSEVIRGGNPLQTQKHPSDLDEPFTQKYPSDDDEDLDFY